MVEIVVFIYIGDMNMMSVMRKINYGLVGILGCIVMWMKRILIFWMS